MLHGQITGTTVRQQLRGGPRVFSCRTRTRDQVQCRTAVVTSALSEAVQQKCDDWLALETDPGRRKHAQTWFTSTAEATVQEAVSQRLVFGR